MRKVSYNTVVEKTFLGVAQNSKIKIKRFKLIAQKFKYLAMRKSL